MYTVRLGETEFGTTSLESGDPPMGVALGTVTLSCQLGSEIEYLTNLGAIEDSSGILVITDNPKLNVVDQRGLRVEAEFCYLAYYDELRECTIEACAIPSEIYEERFPNQCADYYGSDT